MSAPSLVEATAACLGACEAVWLSCSGTHAQEQVRRSLVTATAASSCLASALMGIGANLPIAAAPGMGLNAYFLSVVGERGSGRVRRRLAPLVTRANAGSFTI